MRRIWHVLVVPALAVTAVTIVRLALDPIMGSRSPLLLHTVTVAIVAQLEGALAGLVATTLSMGCVTYFFLSRSSAMFPLHPSDAFSLGIFLLVNVVLSWFGGRRQRIARDLHLANDNLRRAQMRLRLKHEAARIGSYEWFVEQGRVEWSPEMEKLYGIKSDTHQHTFEEWQSMVHPDDLSPTLQTIETAMARRQPVLDTSYRIVRRDGQLRWIHSRGVYEYSPAGQPVYMLGANIDITEQKLAEEGLRETNAQLEAILDSIPEPVMVTDAQGNLIRHNAAFVEAGLPQPADSQDPRVTLFTEAGEIIPPEHWPINRVRRGERISGLTVLLDVSGLRTYRRVSGSPVQDAQGNITHAVLTFYDITDQKRAEQNLHTVQDELRRSNADLESFAYTVSHDLSEPLRQVRSFAELLALRLTDLDGDSRTFLNYLTEGATRMDKMMQGLLHYSRMGASDQPQEPVDLNAVLEAVLSNLHLQIESSNATLDVEPLPTVMAWPGRMDQVLQNLIQNAIKYRRPGTAPQIRISVRRAGGQWLFGVHDNGIGFRPQDAQSLFRVFRQLHARGAYEGTGIGLSIVKRIVERHGGQVCAESDPGVGSSFYFTLPVAA